MITLNNSCLSYRLDLVCGLNSDLADITDSLLTVSSSLILAKQNVINPIIMATSMTIIVIATLNLELSAPPAITVNSWLPMTDTRVAPTYMAPTAKLAPMGNTTSQLSSIITGTVGIKKNPSSVVTVYTIYAF